jgi:hypothetical protein
LQQNLLPKGTEYCRVERVANPYPLVRQPVRERLQRPLRDVMLGHLVFDAINHAARRESDFLIVID